MTAGFVSLLRRNDIDDWQSAVRLVETAPADATIDVGLLPPVYRSLEQIWLTFWHSVDAGQWKRNTMTLNRNQADRTVVGIFDILRTIRTSSGRVSDDGLIVSTFFFSADGGSTGREIKHALFRTVLDRPVRTMQLVRDIMADAAELPGHRQALAADRIPTAIVRIHKPNDRPSGDKLYDSLNTDICFGNRLCRAVCENKIETVVDLLKNLPIIELDLYVDYIDRKTAVYRDPDWISSEYWTDDDRFDLLFAVARTYMTRYRRDRDIDVRTLLADVLPYDVFVVIESYGAQPLIRRRVS